MCVCIRVCVCVVYDLSGCERVCLRVLGFVCVRLCMCVFMCLYLFVCACPYMSVLVNVCVCVFVCFGFVYVIYEHVHIDVRCVTSCGLYVMCVTHVNYIMHKNRIICTRA